MAKAWKDQAGKVWMQGAGEVGQTMEWNGIELTCFEISDAELAEILGPVTPSQKEVLLASLAAIDQQAGMVRGVREIALAFGTLTKLLKDNGLTYVPDTTTNAGMVKVKNLEDQAKQIRAQLAQL